MEENNKIVQPAEKNTQFSQSVISKYPRKQSRGLNNIIVSNTVPKERNKLVKYCGWGYKDSSFVVVNGMPRFSGNRYLISNKNLPFLIPYTQEKFDIHLCFTDSESDAYIPPSPDQLPKSLMPPEIMDGIKDLGIEITDDPMQRFIRQGGQAFDDVHRIKHYTKERIPDAIAFPTCHEEVVELVKFCDTNNIVIIPYGGGTSVAGALTCPENENRPILSVDFTDMNEILWIDKESLVMCAEAGIVGQDLERELNKVGYTTGHEPDSIEFSTLGGWVSTRASGMKKNMYGNIEELMQHVRMVTPRGVLERGHRCPRVSGGPDFNHLILGSEGCFGIITEVCLKIRPLPEHKRYGSVVFCDFVTGIKFMREVARRRWQPASIRLLDHEQMQFGLAVRPEGTLWANLLDSIKFGFLEKVKKWNLKKISLCTIVYEGTTQECVAQERRILALAKEFDGISGGSKNGNRGYMMTYVVAYLRDIACEIGLVSDSLETSVPWDRAIEINSKVRNAIIKIATQKFGIKRISVMLRVAQTYDSGCCLYIYFSYRAETHVDDTKAVPEIHDAARDLIISCGGSISHHHGVGKHRRNFYEQSVSNTGVNLFLAAKRQLDPKNIFGSSNIIPESNILPSKL